MIIRRIGEVAYTLQLPSFSKIHPTFHVSQLKKHHGPPPTYVDPSSLHIPTMNLTRHPTVVIDKRSIRKGNHVIVQWLVHWSNSSPEDATWVDVTLIE